MANTPLGFIPDIVLIHGKTSDEEIIPIAVDSEGKVLLASNLNYKGWYATEAALKVAYPTADDGDYAIVGTTDTVWVWDSDTTAWLDSGLGSLVTSVFGRVGPIVAVANDYTWAQINKATSDLADITTKSHTSLTDKGTNTHAQIDAHISQHIISRSFSISGNNFAIDAGYKGHVKAPFPKCDIVRVDMESAGGVGNTTSVLDIWKCTQAEYDDNVTHPAVGDTITAAAKPTISAGVKSTDSTLTGWTKTNFVTGDVFGINVDSNDVAKLLIVTIYFQWKAT